MKSILKGIGVVIALWMWATLGYKLGYDACTYDTSYNDLSRENAKLKEELKNKKI